MNQTVRIETISTVDATAHLPDSFVDWFAQRGWSPRPHQLKLLGAAQAGESALLIAPTGAGKTLAGFLPSLTDLAGRTKRRPGEARKAGGLGIHTLYISPIKALAVDIERNLKAPIEQMNLNITLETRTGDTPVHKRQRQKLKPPDILMTTPEQVALLIAAKDADRFFEDLRFVVFDELHSLVTSKRGHLLSLGLARLRKLAPDLQTIGLSATVAQPDELRRWLVPQNQTNDDGEVPDDEPKAQLVTVTGGAKPDIEILDSEEHVPWSGHMSKYAVPDILEAIKAHRTTIIFVNTRSQAELLFQEFWHHNEDNLPIALHHGSLDVNQRRKVEAAMDRNELRAVIATSTLDLGLDWGDVDLVVHMGAPKGASRLAQRIGRSNHRMDEPSEAILVPSNRFEVLECRAALEANYLGAQDTPPLREGALDVLAQHIMGMAVAKPFQTDDLYREIISALPYARITRATFDQAVQFVATGGYALKTYERFAKIKQTEDGSWRVTHPRFAQAYRLNVGTITAATELKIRYGKAGKGIKQRGGAILGKIEELFLETLTQGDTFLFAGKVLRFEGIRDNECIVSNAPGAEAKVPYYAGGKFPLSSFLAETVRKIMSDPQRWPDLPDQVADWLRIQEQVSVMPGPQDLLVETFPKGNRNYIVMYPFEGKLAHQTMGMLMTRRMERADWRPLGFVASDYALSIWGLEDYGQLLAQPGALDAFFSEEMMGDDLEEWLDESFMLKRTFRYCAMISGLIEQRQIGAEKTGRQVTMSTDLIFDVLRSHEPDHLLMKATRADATSGLLDIHRLGDLLSRTKGRIIHKALDRISPLAVPVMLEAGKEPVLGNVGEGLLAEAASFEQAQDDILHEAFGEHIP
ncbi:MAG: ligase-associated DNA damage response DEXH box helicase [Pseudomonadota bacterium]